MLECNKVITIVHHSKEIDGDLYVCKSYNNASWYKRNTITTSADGAKPVNTYEARIMTAEGIDIAQGDYVVLCKLQSVNKPSDLKEFDHFRITAIGDNRRGLLAHWRVSGQ